ncbi:glycerophosphodiester phosphodiesterase [Actinomadura scrupuli]|uniref:glycerophosphodiester phosphodiesterase n=1 Tax=Actinomadura scrupuli TaxID=559629 RepID=UPI003D989A6F
MFHLKHALAGGLAIIATAAVTAGLTGGGAALAGPSDQAKPLVIAHRGASAYRPEHTLGAYKQAIDMGADYIEPDLVQTKDGVLVARHENALGGTTDVSAHPEFADRKKTKAIDGVTSTDWFSEDFTFAELRTLRAKERLPDLRPENTAFDGQDQIPTLDEVIDLAQRNNVGVYPETKHPTYFASIGLPFETRLLTVLKRHGLDRHDSKVFIQSFEPGILERLRPRTKVNLVQLINSSGQPYDFAVAHDPRTYADLVKPDGLRWLSGFVNGIGPATNWIIPVDASGRTGTPTTLVKDAHRDGLVVHPWAVRAENNFLPVDFRRGNPASPVYLRAQGDATGWLSLLLKQGIDGVFTDDSALAVATRTESRSR